ncbi:MAG: flagellar hook-length control protein FliK [Sulfurimicrobium sp.]
MIQNDLSTQLQLLIKTSAPPLLEVSQQQLELPQVVPGQKLPAFVVANLPNGRFQVLIADKMLDMNLPRNTQPGDTLDLVFVTARPRLTFVLASDLANVAHSGNAANTKPQVSLSETARFLGGLLEKAAQPDREKNVANAAVRATPLLSGAPANTLEFAQALRGALTRSGLFYESHQAQWVAGQRPLTDLLSEPQGRLSGIAANAPSAAPGASSPQVASHAQNPERAQQPLPAPHDLSNPPSGKTLAPDQIAHPDTLPLVRQQLEVLDSRQMAWQGQVWPGQTMDWKIEERPAREQKKEGAMPEWQTSLHLVLPHLGAIAANLVLHPQGIRIQLDATDPASATLLAQQRIALQQGMETSGLRLLEMKVRHEGE